MRRAPSRGQFIVGGVAFLAALMIVIQAMVIWTQQNTGWTVKAVTSDRALNAAHAGVQHAYWTLAKQAANWETVQAGGAITGYRFDQTYTDNEQGTYTVSISTAGSNAVKITAIGRGAAKGEIRAIEAVYTKTVGVGSQTVTLGGALNLSGGNWQVEWGAVASPAALTLSGRTHPQFWSAQGVDSDANGSAAPNCDAACVQWHSFSSGVSAAPAVDLDYYKTAAQAAGTYYNGAQTWKSKTLSGIHYVDGDLTIGSPGDYIQGSLIVMGNLNLPNGGFGTGVVDMKVPTDAWKQYANDWSYYRTNFDPTAPAAFPGLASGYSSDPALTKTNSSVLMNGFLYVSGSISASGGGGGSTIYGAVIIGGGAALGSSSACSFYFNPEAAVGIRFSAGAGSGSDGYVQTAWEETILPWPNGLP